MERERDEGMKESLTYLGQEGTPMQRIDDRSVLYFSILFTWLLELYALFRITQMNAQHQMRMVVLSVIAAVLVAVVLYRHHTYVFPKVS